ncbi:MAG TPA: hypothetical protein VJ818_06880 [Actinomycetota bacterium]|nr:hypothetical protein [Actinomycetota bacterium]
MSTARSARRLAAVAVIGLIAATGCSAAKTAATPPASSTPAATASSTPAVDQSIDLSGLDRGLSAIDAEVSGANAGLRNTSEGDVQTQ